MRRQACAQQRAAPFVLMPVVTSLSLFISIYICWRQNYRSVGKPSEVLILALPNDAPPPPCMYLRPEITFVNNEGGKLCGKGEDWGAWAVASSFSNTTTTQLGASMSRFSELRPFSSFSGVTPHATHKSVVTVSNT